MFILNAYVKVRKRDFDKYLDAIDLHNANSHIKAEYYKQLIKKHQEKYNKLSFWKKLYYAIRPDKDEAFQIYCDSYNKLSNIFFLEKEKEIFYTKAHAIYIELWLYNLLNNVYEKEKGKSIYETSNI